MEGFAHVLEKDPEWPSAGSKLVWQSIPGGRGRVTERVVSWVAPNERAGEALGAGIRGGADRHADVSFEPAEGGTRVALELRYELQPTTWARQGPIGKVTDVLFIRRALSDSLARTLRRFATEAGEEVAL